MADSGAIDAALVAKLAADATLAALMPGGVYFDEAPANVTRFVVVSLLEAVDTGMQGGRSHETATYSILATAFSSVSTAQADVRAAAARIDALLQFGSLTVAGYALMSMQRTERVRPPVEVDDKDVSLRWHRRGGQYEIMVSL